MPLKEEDNLGQCTPRMTLLSLGKEKPGDKPDDLMTQTTSVITNFTPLHAENLQEKLTNEYVIEELNLSDDLHMA